jgi:hypothetical protein
MYMLMLWFFRAMGRTVHLNTYLFVYFAILVKWKVVYCFESSHLGRALSDCQMCVKTFGMLTFENSYKYNEILNILLPSKYWMEKT